MLGDYHHEQYSKIVEQVVSVTDDFKKYVPASDNNLINGMNDYNCSQITNSITKCRSNAPFAKFRFHSGKTYRLRLINAGAAALQRFSIDGHTLQVIANDFTPIVPYETDVVSLGAGQRSDVLVKAIGKSADAFWMRATLAANCSRSTSLYGKGVVLYENADPKTTPNTTAYTLPEVNCANVSAFSFFLFCFFFLFFFFYGGAVVAISPYLRECAEQSFVLICRMTSREQHLSSQSRQTPILQ